MALLASCPPTKGEFRIWAWSSKTEKLAVFRDEPKNLDENQDLSNPVGQLHWSRNGKVVQFLQGYGLIYCVLMKQGRFNLGCQEASNSKRIILRGY
jgi:hypothetical protein